MNDPKEEEIGRLLTQGCRDEAFELLLGHYRNRVIRLVFSFINNYARAEEVAQDIFLKLWQVLERFDGRASLSTWIYTIARNTCLSHIRSESFRKALPLESSPEPATISEAGKIRMEIKEMVARLPQRQGRIVRLFYLQERSIKDVAAMLNLPEGTIKSDLHQARKSLGVMLEEGSCPVVSRKK